MALLKLGKTATDLRQVNLNAVPDLHNNTTPPT
jgi:hypothetical protein